MTTTINQNNLLCKLTTKLLLKAQQQIHYHSTEPCTTSYLRKS